MKSVKVLLCSVVITPAFCLPSWAEDETATSEVLETVTVIATKTPKAPLDSPASVSVISEDEISAFNSEQPFKPLFRTEGIYPRQYRGLADYWSRPMMRGQRALVLLDGLDWYDYGQYYHTGAIPMKDVEKIEVVRGPFSALYGTLAQTGVINYITKTPYGPEATASITYGDNNTKYYSARIADRPFAAQANSGHLSWAEKTLGNRFFYSMSFKYRTTDGYETNPYYVTPASSHLVSGALDPSIPIAANPASDSNPTSGATRYIVGTNGDNWYEDHGAFLKAGYEFSEAEKIWYSYNNSEFDYGWRGGKSVLTQADGTPITSGDYYLQDGADIYEYALTDNQFTATSYQKASSAHTLHYDNAISNKLDVNGLLGYNDKETRSHSVSSAYAKIEANDLLQADLSATVHLMDNHLLLTLGTQGVKETATVTKYNLSSPSDPDSHSTVQTRDAGENLTWGTFVQAEYTPIDSTTLYLGGRYDHWWATDTEFSDINGNHATGEDTDDGQFSPKASVVYRLTDNGVLRGSFGKSFTAPSLYYRIASYSYQLGGETTFGTGNPDLKPYTNTSWEIGTEWELMNRQLRVKGSYFQNDYDDYIAKIVRTQQIDGESVDLRTYYNVGSAKVDGLELAVEARLPWRLKGGLHYTHHWSEYLDTDPAYGKAGWEVDEVPTDIFNGWLGYFTDAVDASLNIRYSDSVYDDKRDPYADSGFNEYSDSFLVDAQITVRPSRKAALTLSVDNLFDEEYYEYYQGPGRTAMATLSLAL